MNDLITVDNRELAKLNKEVQNGLKLVDDIVLKNYLLPLASFLLPA